MPQKAEYHAWQSIMQSLMQAEYHAEGLTSSHVGAQSCQVDEAADKAPLQVGSVSP